MRRIGLVLIPLLLTLFLAEESLRLFAVPELQQGPEKTFGAWVDVPEKKWVDYHDVLGWYPQANKKALLETKFIHQKIQTNSAGFRGEREYGEMKPAGVTRILALGDSFTFGFGVADFETFSRRLEDTAPLLEVPNMGVPGYGIDQVLMLYRKMGSRYQHDVVLINIFPEMFWRATRSFTAGGYAKPYFKLTSDGHLALRNIPVPQPYMTTQGQFPELFQKGFWRSCFDHSLLYQLVQNRMTRLERKLFLIDPDLSAEWKIGQKILGQLVDEIRENGAKPVLVIVPPENWVRSSEKNQPHRSILRFAKRNHLSVIDLTPPFYKACRQTSIEKYYIQGDWHWTSRGHALAASEIETYLKQHRLLSGLNFS